MTTVSTQEVLTQAIVSVMTVNIVASAMGMLTIGAAIPSGIPAADRGIRDLRQTFGTEIVNTAIKNVGRDDILILASEVASLYENSMRRKYGDFATTQALASAPPGDLRTANEIATVLAGQKVTESSPSAEVERAVSTGEKKARVKKAAQPQLDTKTGIKYDSKAKAGMAVAAEYDLNSKDHFIWYSVIKKDPTRFKPV